MAESTILKSSLSLTYVNGQDSDGKDVSATQSFNSLKTGALTDDIYAVASAMATLLISDSVEIHRKDDSLVIMA